MDTEQRIHQYLNSLPEAKADEMQLLHTRIEALLPGSKRWFHDGRDENGKVVSNPNIGYGAYTIHYKDGSTKEFFRIGLSANTAGISVYIMGLEDKTYLPNTYGNALGKAKITGYCIKFKSVKDIDLQVLDAAILDGMKQ